MVPLILNSSCEACRASKVKCSGERTCKRCSAKSMPCVYHPRKRRGKPRDKQVPSYIQKVESHSPLKTNDFVPRQSNEVLDFCLHNGFPIKFINAILRGGVKTFQVASEITESELQEKFGSLSYEHLLLWRTKIRETLYQTLCCSSIGRNSTISSLSCNNQVQAPSQVENAAFEEGQCAQFMTGLKRQAQNLANGSLFLRNFSQSMCPDNASNNVNNLLQAQLPLAPRSYQDNSPVQSFCSFFEKAKKRRVENVKIPEFEAKPEKSAILSLPSEQKPKLKDRMQVVDWLVSLLQRLETPCSSTTSKAEIKDEKATSVEGLKACLDEIVGKIVSLEASNEARPHPKEVECEKMALLKLKRRTLGLLQEQFDLLKANLDSD